MSAHLGRLRAPNRLVRSATYEGWGDGEGVPRLELAALYRDLAAGGVGTLITGFAFVAAEGRAMQPGQCGITTPAHTEAWRRVIGRIRPINPEMRLIMQLAHCGRQTRRESTGMPVVGASTRHCSYFRQATRSLDADGIARIVGAFAAGAGRAQEAGFDGVQVHAAHGYLLHQFLSPWTNNRHDRWGEPLVFLAEVIEAVRRTCGDKFVVLVKLSASDDNQPGVRLEDTVATVRGLEQMEVDAVEISYGTMEYAFNIIRGEVPIDLLLRENPLLRNLPWPLRWWWRRYIYPRHLARLKPFSEDYNLAAAVTIRRATTLPIIAAGGFRSLQSMVETVTTHGLDAVSLCRPLICEPDLPQRLRQGQATRSRCCNCNLCTVSCDSDRPVRCYQRAGGALRNSEVHEVGGE